MLTNTIPWSLTIYQPERLDMKISLRSLFVACLIAPVAFTYASELQEMKIVLLGTKGGPSLLKADRLPMATALIIGNKTWLIDAG
ncbi:MBL fold metallo-hydrolase, partial [Escherichia coli]|nr:MBL fold metallo-hydrolase [Escherichia coli]